MLNSYDALMKKANELEINIDLRLMSLSKFCSEQLFPPSNFQKNTVSESQCESIFLTEVTEVENLLKDLSDVNEKLESSALPSENTQIQVYTRQRHKVILSDYRRDFMNIQENYRLQNERKRLLCNVRSEIDELKSNYNRRADLYLKEKRHLGNSNQQVDDQIRIAIETRDQLVTQRKGIQNLQSRLSGLSSKFPVVNNLIGSIGYKKRKQSIILALILLCITLFFQINYLSKFY